MSMLPKLDTPVYEVELPLSKKLIKFRPFVVKEQKVLLMAMESEDTSTVEKSVNQILQNCTLNDINLATLPVLDVEYYFLQLRARSVGEIVESRYRCDNKIDDKTCGNIMETKFNLLNLQVEGVLEEKEMIHLTPKVGIKLKYPDYSTMTKLSKLPKDADIAVELVAECVEYLWDGENYFHTAEIPRNELIDFLEKLNQLQYDKIEAFFQDMPKLQKKLQVKCGKCGYEHRIEIEGLESFFA